MKQRKMIISPFFTNCIEDKKRANQFIGKKVKILNFDKYTKNYFSKEEEFTEKKEASETNEKIYILSSVIEWTNKPYSLYEYGVKNPEETLINVEKIELVDEIDYREYCRPFVPSEKEELRDEWVIHNETGAEYKIIGLIKEHNFLFVLIGNKNHIIGADELLRDYSFLDNTPCGVWVKDN